MYNVISAQKLMRGEKVPWNFPVLAFDFDQKDNQDKESVSSEASSTTTTSRKTSYDINERSNTRSSKQKKTKDKPKKVQDEAEAFRCSHCYYTSGNWEQFEQHMNVGHKLAPLFPCMIPSCWTYYQSKNGLKGHCRRLHSDVLSCSLCNHVAVGTTALQEHERNHSEKKFPCDACNQGFSSRYDMRRHFEKCPKNPERKISCKQCTSVGAHVDVPGGISGLITHCIQDHALKGDWLCTHCHRLYTSERRLENHILKCSNKNKVSTDLTSTSEISETE